MNFTCTECNDTGSRDKLGTYLDCNACGTAATRRDLNDFVKSLGPTHPEDVALAIHQRALAMAPKQEAQPNLEPLRKWAKDAANGKTDKIPYIDITDLINENIELRAAFAASGGNAAPAAANGALPELPAPATLIVENDLGHRAYTADQMRAYGQACHAMGRGAAVREYVENGTFKKPTTANGALTDDQINTIWESLPGLKIVAGRPIDHWNSLLRHEFARAILAAAGPDAALAKALEDITAIKDKVFGSDWQEIDEARTIARAALSGAKGN